MINLDWISRDLISCTKSPSFKCSRAPSCSVLLAYWIQLLNTVEQISIHIDSEALSIKNQVRLEQIMRHAADFFGGVFCKVVLLDMTQLLDQFLRKANVSANL